MGPLLNLMLSHPYATLILLAVIAAAIKFGPAAGGSYTADLGGHSSEDGCSDGDVGGFDGGGCVRPNLR